MDIFLQILDDVLLDRMYDALHGQVDIHLCQGSLEGTTGGKSGSTSTHLPAPNETNWGISSVLCDPETWQRDHALRQTLSLFLGLWSISTLTYLIFGTMCYFVLFDFKLKRHPKYRPNQIRGEITESLQTLLLANLMTAPIFVAQVRGYAKLYTYGAGGFPIWYEIVQFPLAVLLMDGGIYVLHRLMHHGLLFRRFHRQHHWYMIPTPFSAYAFHPVEAWFLSLPVYMYGFLFPMSKLAQISILVYSNAATFLDHDSGFHWHTVHHRGLESNFGQLISLWDRLFGTYESPERYAKRTTRGRGKEALMI